MQIILNLGVIGMVLLIAYWWANQGALSAFLHFICVVAAGAIALAVWEPVTTQFLLAGGFWDSYVWGLSLIGVFALTLFVLRVIMDKTIRANVDLPPWMNYAFGFPVGAAAGVLTVGIVIIGCGFMQSTNEIMGVRGASRTAQRAMVGVESDQRLWLPAHEIAYEFYGWLSVTSLGTSRPLRQYSPRLDWQAVSLIRDTWDDGKGRISQQPDDAKVEALIQCNDCRPPRWGVTVHFDAPARDYGEQLTLSRSQIWLIGEARGTSGARMAFPESWSQYDGWHQFDDRSHYVTSQPGQESADVTLEFLGDDLGNQPPRFIQIRNIRYRLPAPQSGSMADLRMAGVASAPTDSTAAPTGSGGGTIQSAIEVSNDIRPINASKNQMPEGISEVDRWLTEGDAVFQTSGDRPSRALMIQGIYQPAETRIVKVDVSPNSPASLFGAIRNTVPSNSAVQLVDDRGRTYSPMGYMYDRPDRSTRVKLDPKNYLRTLDQIPELPTASQGHRLRLIFVVTVGARLSELKVGSVSVGTCDVPITTK